MSRSFTIVEQGQISVLKILLENWDATCSFSLNGELKELPLKPRVVVDLSQVEFIDSVGIGMLRGIIERCGSHNLRVVVKRRAVERYLDRIPEQCQPKCYKRLGDAVAWASQDSNTYNRASTANTPKVTELSRANE